MVLVLICGSGYAQLADASAKVAAEFCIKISAWEKGIAGGGDVTIYVLDNPEVAQELTNFIGKPIGKSILIKVEEGNTLPSSKPSILFVGNPRMAASAIQYSRENDVLSVSHAPSLCWEGVTLGFGIERLKPRIILNLSSSVAENLDWNPAIMKIAKTMK